MSLNSVKIAVSVQRSASKTIGSLTAVPHNDNAKTERKKDKKKKKNATGNACTLWAKVTRERISLSKVDAHS